LAKLPGMKQGGRWCFPRYDGLMLCCVSLVLASCDSYYFLRPQPVDQENILTVPKEFQGRWIADDSSTYVYFSKKSVELVMQDYERIIKGAWPKVNDTGAFVYPPGSFRALETVTYDSLRKPVDTILNYLVRDQIVYEINSDGLLEKGYSFKLDADTLRISKMDTILIDLGKNAFFRKLKNHTYAFNIRYNLLADKSPWWYLTILEKTDKDSIRLWDPAEKIISLPAMFYDRGHAYYFDCHWTSAELLSLMDGGYFNDNSQLFRAEK
jgi:hypothetical protein